MATGGRLALSKYKVCDVILVSSFFLLFCNLFLKIVFALIIMSVLPHRIFLLAVVPMLTLLSVVCAIVVELLDLQVHLVVEGLVVVAEVVVPRTLAEQ